LIFIKKNVCWNREYEWIDQSQLYSFATGSNVEAQIDRKLLNVEGPRKKLFY